MITLDLEADDYSILNALYSWVELVASGRYDDAHAMLYHPPRDLYTPKVIRERVMHYAEQFDEPFTLPPTHCNETAPHLIVRPDFSSASPTVLPSGRMIGTITQLVTASHFEDPYYLGDVELSLPFGNQWSDVIAFFKLYNHNNRLAFILSDIRNR